MTIADANRDVHSALVLGDVENHDDVRVERLEEDVTRIAALCSPSSKASRLGSMCVSAESSLVWHRKARAVKRVTRKQDERFQNKC